MDNRIKTKFTVASEEGIAVLQYLGETRGYEKYGALLNEEQLADYLFDQYNRDTIISNLNTFSNQLIVVYKEEKPAGFAYLTGKGAVPEPFSGRRVFHLGAFEILNAFKESEVMDALMEKCMIIGKSYDALKLMEKADETDMIAFYEKYGFHQRASEPSVIAGVSFPSLVLIRENNRTISG
ncbi:GNAT family N-acetyltransferase [Pedobacter sp. FW305-3-2-15-E-R2A2]|uniref:GNAT family N-acetyltransferase n=1 Tax=Pedobacter sp. FW305-3-2-15-E-R2A2 TaxID=3140251 RepID=UPI0031406D1E